MVTSFSVSYLASVYSYRYRLTLAKIYLTIGPGIPKSGPIYSEPMFTLQSHRARCRLSRSRDPGLKADQGSYTLVFLRLCRLTRAYPAYTG